MQPMAIYQPSHLTSSEPPDLSSMGYRFLAEGDSWFSIGTLNPAKNSNLLFELEFEKSACAVNCATPGDTLGHMAQMNSDPNFTRMLRGPLARVWDGVLMSCGGNDLIDAVGVRGPNIAPEQRLLLNEGEWGALEQGPARYLSDPGWATFTAYVQANLDHLIALRDGGPSAGVPVFLHGYAYPMPRPSGAGPHMGPWLFPAVTAYGIPEADIAGVATLLLQRLAALLTACAADAQRYPNLHFFDTTLIPVTPAEAGSSGESGDWVNEIHLTWRGYEKLARPWGAAIEEVLAQRC